MQMDNSSVKKILKHSNLGLYTPNPVWRSDSAKTPLGITALLQACCLLLGEGFGWNWGEGRESWSTTD